MTVLDVLLPPACACCRRHGRLLCDRCLGRVRPLLREDHHFVVPRSAVAGGDALDLAVAAVAYEGPVRRALAALKYERASRLVSPLAALMEPALDAVLEISGPAVLIPVPVHDERRRERGYNQAELLAARLAETRGLPLDAAALRRGRATTQQHRLDRSGRLRNLRDAFRASGRSPPVVVLADDIITTAATLEACAHALRAVGATAVYGVALARDV